MSSARARTRTFERLWGGALGVLLGHHHQWIIPFLGISVYDDPAMKGGSPSASLSKCQPAKRCCGDG